jgi:hypothetical protein
MSMKWTVMLSTEVTHSFYASLTTRSHKHCRSFADLPAEQSASEPL